MSSTSGSDGFPASPDKARIAADEARGIVFSDDKRTLVEYNKELEDREYAVPAGVTVIGDGAFSECPCEESVKRRFPDYDPAS